jgi:hypothetical protein
LNTLSLPDALPIWPVLVQTQWPVLVQKQGLARDQKQGRVLV